MKKTSRLIILLFIPLISFGKIHFIEVGSGILSITIHDNSEFFTAISFENSAVNFHSPLTLQLVLLGGNNAQVNLIQELETWFISNEHNYQDLVFELGSNSVPEATFFQSCGRRK